MSDHLIAVDPGVRGCGVAVFDVAEGKLISASYVKNTYSHDNGLRSAYCMARAVAARYEMLYFTEFCGEVPRIYPAGSQKGDQNDLIAVAGVIFAVVAQPLFSDCAMHTYFPRDWKGTIDKKVMTARIKGRLSASEEACVNHIGALDHNTYDAVGIGLYRLGRLKPKQVYGGVND